MIILLHIYDGGKDFIRDYASYFYENSLIIHSFIKI